MRQMHLELYGNHRGGTALVQAMPSALALGFDRRWRLADPAEGRAPALAALAAARFAGVEPVALRTTAQQAILAAPADAAIVLALDTVQDTAATLALAHPDQAITFQIVGRGPGGVGGARFGLAGAAGPGDATAREGALAILEGLARLARPGSSRVLTSDDVLAARLLASQRTRVTSLALEQLEGLRDGGPGRHGAALQVVLAGDASPLVPVRLGGSPGHRELRDVALQAASATEARSERRAIVVAIVQVAAPIVHFATVVDVAGKPRVEQVVTLQPPRAGLLGTPPAPAVFTD